MAHLTTPALLLVEETMTTPTQALTLEPKLEIPSEDVRHALQLLDALETQLDPVPRASSSPTRFGPSRPDWSGLASGSSCSG